MNDAQRARRLRTHSSGALQPESHAAVPPHRIDAEQNKPERIELLQAQRLFYARAKRYQNSFAVIAFLLPVVGAIFGARFPGIRPFLGFGSILVLLLEVGIIARKQRDDCRRGAKVQEQFDTEVLMLDWNRLVAGGKVDAEDIRAIASKPLQDAERKRLLNWYEPAISRLPLAVGRLICQRTNVTYDMRVRRMYAGTLLASAIVLVVILTLVGLCLELTLNEFISTWYLPVLPFAAFVLREHRKQGDTVETLTTLKGEVDKLWDRALNGASSDELTAGSRALQDAIYRHRASNPLVFDWLYNRLRARNEDVAQHATETLVAEAQRKLMVEGHQ
ncbi:S-4TM family putative pore-forming effector [Pandoraea sp. SD6-2]|uniref:S-4TM family putative pore-forming effector n=1 Tax=Pandoraea sp. SD6-2 TaxID=1286093 RepID=UPI00032E8C95|nr:S-4TM family putative pore-forming effector [Pandoraea sp. SD6-2]EON11733.1 hypothetical protein C266_20989 [Pandoraea sp. SD6-2]